MTSYCFALNLYSEHKKNRSSGVFIKPSKVLLLLHTDTLSHSYSLTLTWLYRVIVIVFSAAGNCSQFLFSCGNKKKSTFVWPTFFVRKNRIPFSRSCPCQLKMNYEILAESQTSVCFLKNFTSKVCPGDVLLLQNTCSF